MAGAPLVWLGQVEVLEVQDEPLAVLGAVHSSRVGGDHQACLGELLKDVRGNGLGTAVDSSHLGGTKLLKAVGEEEPVWEETMGEGGRVSAWGGYYM